MYSACSMRISSRKICSSASTSPSGSEGVATVVVVVAGATPATGCDGDTRRAIDGDLSTAEHLQRARRDFLLHFDDHFSSRHDPIAHPEIVAVGRRGDVPPNRGVGDVHARGP